MYRLSCHGYQEVVVARSTRFRRDGLRRRFLRQGDLVCDQHASNRCRGERREHTGEQGRERDPRYVASAGRRDLRQDADLGTQRAEVAEA